MQIARDGHLEELESYISNSQNPGENINELDNKENSALHYAARYSHIEIVATLVETLGAKTNVVGSDKMTPVHYASRYGKNVTVICDDYQEDSDTGLQVLKMLINYGGDVRAKDFYHLTPLHHAAMRGNIKIVEHLVKDCGVDVNARDKMGSTPLHIAATYKNVEVVRILLAHDVDISLKDKQRQTPLHRAAQEGCAEIIEAILESFNEKDEEAKEAAMVDEDDDGNSPVILAVEAGNSAAVSVFLEGECSNFINKPNKQGECQIHFAARSGDLDTMEMLLDKGAEVNKKNANNQTALFLAASSETTKKVCTEGSEKNENVKMVQMLIERYNDV